MANLEMHVGDSKLLTVVPKEGDVVVPPEDVTGDQFSYTADPGSLMPVGMDVNWGGNKLAARLFAIQPGTATVNWKCSGASGDVNAEPLRVTVTPRHVPDSAEIVVSDLP